MITTARSVLAIFAHPDDETLSAGGALAKLTRSGAKVSIGIAATGLTARDPSADAEAIAALQDQTRAAAARLGAPADQVHFGGFPDNRMDSVPLIEVNRWVEDLCAQVEPDFILTHHARCTNIDHRICFEACTVASRPTPGRRIALASAETPSSTGYLRPTQFEPSLYVELSEADLDAKCEALACYRSEAMRYPHPRSPDYLRALAAMRGGEIGCERAEAFMLIRGFS